MIFFTNYYHHSCLTSDTPLAEKKHRLCFYFCGFNITIIAALFALIVSRILVVGRGPMTAAIGIILYTLLARANQSVI
jgi:hypothetical protein